MLHLQVRLELVKEGEGGGGTDTTLIPSPRVQVVDLHVLYVLLVASQRFGADVTPRLQQILAININHITILIITKIIKK